jgi:hypothetical protein
MGCRLVVIYSFLEKLQIDWDATTWKMHGEWRFERRPFVRKSVAGVGNVFIYKLNWFVSELSFSLHVTWNKICLYKLAIFINHVLVGCLLLLLMTNFFITQMPRLFQIVKRHWSYSLISCCGNKFCIELTKYWVVWIFHLEPDYDNRKRMGIKVIATLQSSI